ncbi:MAG: CHASE2 domain-containing protein, partial [Desulfobacterales bacterium]|nr:CHASE2 domain-containing protein [Desulfobacterales bacterium]
MDIKRVLSSSRAMCLLLMLVILTGMLFGFKPLLLLEYKAYDLISGLRHRNAGIPVIMVVIDDKSIHQVGDWPWPRSYIAD